MKQINKMPNEKFRNCGRQTADQWHSVTPQFSMMEGCCAAVLIMESSPTVRLITSICLTNDKSGPYLPSVWVVGRNQPDQQHELSCFFCCCCWFTHELMSRLSVQCCRRHNDLGWPSTPQPPHSPVSRGPCWTLSLSGKPRRSSRGVPGGPTIHNRTCCQTNVLTQMY